jgi:thioredoxin reductase
VLSLQKILQMTRKDFIKQGGLALSILALPFPLTAFTKYNKMIEKINFDVIIIGGSYAGLSSAMALGRSLRNVLIIDSGLPCNRQTPYSHNFITQDGEKPNAIAEKAKEQVLKYDTIKFHNSLAVNGIKTEYGFEITTNTNDKFTAKKLIFATGIKDIMPDIKGFSECWGISIVHCPYCHGYEYRDQNTGIIANGQKAFHLASMVNNLTKSISILTNGKADLTAEQTEKLIAHKITIIETEISEIEQVAGKLNKIIFKDGSEMAFDVAYATIPFTQHSDIPASLGCELTEQGYIKINPMQKTTIAHIYACGDNSSMMRSVANAVSSGNMAGAIANGELVQEQF